PHRRLCGYPSVLLGAFTLVSYDRRQWFIRLGEASLGSRRADEPGPPDPAPPVRPRGRTDEPGPPAPVPPVLPRGLRARLRRRPLTRYPYLALVALTGAAVIAAGIVLLPLPGPGWVVIFVGLGIWASEFRWAARLLRWVQRRVLAWARWLSRRSPVTRTLLTLLLGAVALAAVSASYIAWRGVPSWVPDWVPLVD